MSTTHPSVLHVWNTAGIASTLAKWTNKVYEAPTNVFSMKEHDPFGHLTYGELRVKGGKRFTTHVLRNIPNYDLIHIHGFDNFVYTIKKHYPKKPIVLHYHGTDIRGRWNLRRTHWRHADTILVSTIDLLEDAPEGVTHLPNPVDISMFYPNSHPNDVDPESALTFRLGAVELARKLAERHGLKLSVLPRNRRFPEMPDLFRQFGWYIDTKRSGGVLFCRSGGSRSLTGLEALACGLNVINSDGDIRWGLPEEHRAENAVKTLRPIYMSLME